MGRGKVKGDGSFCSRWSEVNDWSLSIIIFDIRLAMKKSNLIKLMRVFRFNYVIGRRIRFDFMDLLVFCCFWLKFWDRLHVELGLFKHILPFILLNPILSSLQYSFQAITIVFYILKLIYRLFFFMKCNRMLTLVLVLLQLALSNEITSKITIFVFFLVPFHKFILDFRSVRPKLLSFLTNFPKFSFNYKAVIVANLKLSLLPLLPLQLLIFY